MDVGLLVVEVRVAVIAWRMVHVMHHPRCVVPVRCIKAQDVVGVGHIRIPLVPAVVVVVLVILLALLVGEVVLMETPIQQTHMLVDLEHILIPVVGPPVKTVGVVVLTVPLLLQFVLVEHQQQIVSLQTHCTLKPLISILLKQSIVIGQMVSQRIIVTQREIVPL